MIIDCFIFFNELDLLEGRLEYLYDHVDYFVIVEADVSFKGRPKGFNFTENISRYRKYLDKIIYLPHSIDVSGYDLTVKPTIMYDAPYWEIEVNQRNHMTKALRLFDKEDICLISDLDEIPNKESILEIPNILAGRPAVSLPQEMFMYNLNQKQFLPWVGTVATRVGIALDQGPELIRRKRWQDMLVAPFIGGWHLTYWGGADQIQSKITNFAHQELIDERTSALDYIQSRIDSGQDIFERNLPYVKVNPYNEPRDFLKAFGKYAGIDIKDQKVDPFSQNVGGWFNKDDMKFYSMVYNQLPNNAHIAEIGSWKGKSASHMATMIANGDKSVKFDCIDTWEGSDVVGEKDDADVLNNRLYDVFINNMKPVEGYYTAIQRSSVEAASNYADHSLDFVFIDAAHDYNNVRADILAWKDKVKPGGTLGGHDHPIPDVERAVQELIGPVEVMGCCWYVRK